MTIQNMIAMKTAFDSMPETEITFIDTDTGSEVDYENEILFAEIMKETGATYIEARAMVQFDCDTLEGARQAIARAVTYERMLKDNPTENARFLREEYYNGQSIARDGTYIQALSCEMADEQAWDFVYMDGITDDYDEMTEAEKASVIYNI